eukprot:31560_1
MGTSISRLRDFALVLSSFVCGFYVGYVSESSFCDPSINKTIEYPLTFTAIINHSNIIHPNHNTHNTNNTNNTHNTNNAVHPSIIRSNLFDETFEWQYFKNRNTEISAYTIPHHKIVFCGIPKNAISMWKMVLLRIHKKKWWLTTQGKIHAMENGLSNFRLWDKNFSYVESIMNDPSWYKAVFIRDPLERILSAVLDKGYTLKLTWETFHQYLLETTMKKGYHFIDQHFRPQHKFCDLYKYADKYHIFSFHNNMDRRIFFEDNRLWDEYGSNGWSIEEQKNNLSKKHNIVKFQNVFRRHSIKSDKYISQAYNIKKIAVMLKYYQYDYILFNLTLPEWICPIVFEQYENMIELLPQQVKKKNPIRFKRTTKLDKLRLSIAVYTDLVELYTVMKIFPSNLQPSCMQIINNCVEYGHCPRTKN